MQAQQNAEAALVFANEIIQWCFIMQKAGYYEMPISWYNYGIHASAVQTILRLKGYGISGEMIRW